MSAHCDFTEQTQSGENRPDLIVRLPGDRFIIVDAKVPDFDFLNALESAEPVKRAEALAAHAAKLKATIKALADRDYPQPISERAGLRGAVRAGGIAVQRGAGRRPRFDRLGGGKADFAGDTGVAHRAAAFGERELAAARADGERAEDRRGGAGTFMSRVVKFTEHFEKIRDGLERANGAFNDAVGSLRAHASGQRRTHRGTRRRKSAKELADIQPLDATLRLPPG